MWYNFDNIKQALMSPDIMAFSIDDAFFILDTDVSDDKVGAVLPQVQDGVKKVIAYSSRTLGKSERNYCTTDMELLVVKYFIEYHKYYLFGRNFVVCSDHEALKWLFSLQEPKHRIARCIVVPSVFDFELGYHLVENMTMSMA